MMVIFSATNELSCLMSYDESFAMRQICMMADCLGPVAMTPDFLICLWTIS